MVFQKSIFKLVIVFVIAIFYYQSNAQHYRLMPLGDSITMGKGDPNTYPGSIYTGYRDDLYILLTNNGWDIDFVGSQDDGDPLLFDVDHEGHSGWFADEIDAQVSLFLSQNFPDIVLLHIGTNDVSGGQPNSTTIIEIESIVDKIYNYKPATAILLCRLIPRTNNEEMNIELNNLIDQLYLQKKADGYNIYLVNHYDAFVNNVNWEIDYMFDNVHPNSTGYNKMAQTFYSVMQTITIPEDSYVLSVSVNPPGSGNVAIDPFQSSYSYGQNVTLTASAYGNYHFDHWSGDIDSDNSNPRTITMRNDRTIVANFIDESGEYVTTPSILSGPTSGSVGVNLTYVTGGSVSSTGKEVEYQFNWGDGNYSTWGGTTQTHSYGNKGTYQIRTMARSKPNPTIMSAWSAAYSVVITQVTITYSLSIDTNPIGAGTVTTSPNKSAYSSGESVQVLAVGNDGTGVILDKIYLEAENGILYGQMNKGNDSNASGNQYIFCSSAQPKSGYAEYTFEVQQTSTYTIWGRCYALSGTMDSFFMVMDQSTDTLTWHLNAPYNSWLWQKVTDLYVVKDFLLTAGTHQLSLISRDQQARLDKLILSKDTSFQPSGIELSPNQPYAFDHWSGDLSGVNNPTTIVMNSDKSITANFVVLNETVTTPNKPTGPPSGRVGGTLTYSTNGTSSSLNHQVQFQFDWGDGSQSSWGSSIASHQYATAGTFPIRARARCAVHTSIVSAWSSSLSVTIIIFTGYSLTVDVSPAGAGTVSKNPAKTAYDEKEWVEVKAIPYREDNNIRLEAESGTIFGSIAVGSTAEASGGKYIYGTTLTPQDGSVEYSFDIEEAGTYTIWGRCYALSNTEDSFFIQVDNGGTILTWHLQNSYGNWLWQKVSDNNVIKQFNFTTGQHKLTVIKRDKNVRLDKFLITNDTAYQPEGKEETMEVRLEAEKGTLLSSITVGYDTEASGGQYIYSTTSTPQDGSAEYTFHIGEAGIYLIWGRCYALSEIEDSFFIQIDGAEILTWHLITTYNSWIWQKATHNNVPQEFYLAIGQHSLKVIKRDKNARLDKIIITKDALFQPTGKEDEFATHFSYRFDHWSGDASGNGNPINILMTSNKSMTAHFIEADHFVDAPTSITGPATGIVGNLLNFIASGASSSLGDNVNYQFDWGDGTMSAWANGAGSHVYNTVGTKQIKSRARSVSDTSTVSNWSETISVAISGFSLSVSIDPANAGQVIKSPDKTEYDYNEAVSLSVSASTGYSFGYWGSDLSGNSNPATIMMNANKSVSAIFIESTETVTKPATLSGPTSGMMGLTLTFTTGGAISSAGNELEYQFDWGDGLKSEWGSGTATHEYYVLGEILVKSRARSKVNTSIISEWTDPYLCSINGYTVVVVVSPPMAGSVVRNPDKYKYAFGETIGLIAEANPGYEFDQWSGDAIGISNPISLLITSNKNISANFKISQEIVTAPTYIIGADTAMVLQSLSFSTGGAFNNLGNPVAYQFSWGDSSQSDWGDSLLTHTYVNPGTMNIKTRARSIVNTSVVSAWSTSHPVVILSNTYKIIITIQPAGKGSVNLTPRKDEYKAGDIVILSPLAAAGYVFDQWGGDLVGISNPAYLTINGNKNIIANFKQINSVENKDQFIPDHFVLRQNYPNPFNSSTMIEFEIPEPGRVILNLYNELGQVIKTLINDTKEPGTYQALWDGTNDYGEKEPSGIKFYKIFYKNIVQVRKLILLN